MKAATTSRLFHCLSNGLTRTIKNTNTNSDTNNIVASSRSRLCDSHTNDMFRRIAPTRHFASVSALSLTSKKRKGQKISVVTAYDFPSAVHVARAGIDVLLVGDSAAMVELGFDTTQPMTLDEMLHHCRSVKRGLDIVTEHKPLLVGDMPFGTYEFEDTDVALRNAYRFVKEAGVDAVKLEVREALIETTDEEGQKKSWLFIFEHDLNVQCNVDACDVLSKFHRRVVIMGCRLGSSLSVFHSCS